MVFEIGQNTKFTKNVSSYFQPTYEISKHRFIFCNNFNFDLRVCIYNCLVMVLKHYFILQFSLLLYTIVDVDTVINIILNFPL